jgi:hypothetical protein
LGGLMDHHIHLVTSDQPRNGKTLLARTLADCLIADGAPIAVMDCDGPQGRLAHWFNDRAHITDLSRTDGQIALFDHILANPRASYVIDLPARHIDRFFEIANAGGFLEETRRMGHGFTTWFILDRTQASFRKARAIWHETQGQIIPVRNESIGSYADAPEVRRSYLELSELGELTLPALGETALKWLEPRTHSFQQLLQPPKNQPLVMRPPSELFVYITGILRQIETIGRL